MRNQHIHAPELAAAKAGGMYEIGDAAEATGVSAKMIRHYESLGLIPKAARTFANYRIYSDKDLHALRFIKRARNLGFSIKEIAELLGLWRNQRRASASVKKLALAHAVELEARIGEMAAMRAALVDLADRCHGDDRPDCPILEDLETGQACHGPGKRR